MSVYSEIFAVRLKELIGSMSVNEFAKQVKIPQQTVWRYLHCQREITLENLCKIADFFHESVDFLIGRSEYDSI